VFGGPNCFSTPLILSAAKISFGPINAIRIRAPCVDNFADVQYKTTQASGSAACSVEKKSVASGRLLCYNAVTKFVLLDTDSDFLAGPAFSATGPFSGNVNQLLQKQAACSESVKPRRIAYQLFLVTLKQF
jgi:hypothetical protein